MFYTYKGKEIVFRFTHITDSDAPTGRATVCRAICMETDDTLSTQVAKVHPNDNFNKETGRQVSLGRVMQELFPKEERHAIWKKYSTWRLPKGISSRMTLHD